MTGTDYRRKQRAPQTSAERTPRTAAHDVRSYKLLKILIVLLAALLTWGLVSWASSMIPLRKVQVNGLTRYGEEEVLAASGLATTKKLLDVNAEYAKQSLTAFYPYIHSVKLRYTFPMGYRLEIVEEIPVYYTCIANDYFALSKDLKVLERATSPRRFLEAGMQQVTLGGIQSAMLGQTLDYGGDYLDQVLEDIGNSVLADRVTDVYIGDRYHLSVVCDEIYTLFLGDIHSIEAKLQLGALMLQDANVPAGYHATLDVSDLKKTSIRYDGVKDEALAAVD